LISREIQRIQKLSNDRTGGSNKPYQLRKNLAMRSDTSKSQKSSNSNASSNSGIVTFNNSRGNSGMINNSSTALLQTQIQNAKYGALNEKAKLAVS
jgi:hypothetical protein